MLPFSACEIPVQTLLHIGQHIVGACVRVIKLQGFLGSSARLEIGLRRWTEFKDRRVNDGMGQAGVRSARIPAILN